MRKILEDNIGNRKIVFWGSSLYNNNHCKTFNYWEKNDNLKAEKIPFPKKKEAK